MMNNFGDGNFFGLGLVSFIGIGIFMLILYIVIIALKGYALWNAAKRGDKWWFIILLIINTFGILELIYLYFVAEKWNSVLGFMKNNNSNDNKSSTSD